MGVLVCPGTRCIGLEITLATPDIGLAALSVSLVTLDTG
ncbi:hypothetical protein AOR13_2779 [Alteromonas stellipolaris LMG 21856]|nr:hypothetical protein AOR13_2779 [Alteromonas stellipolaris LMG 21856]